MRRSRPRQHKRKLSGGRRIVVNRGVMKKRMREVVVIKKNTGVASRKEFDELQDNDLFRKQFMKKNFGFMPVPRRDESKDLVDGLTVEEIELMPVHRRTERQHLAIETPLKSFGFVAGVSHLQRVKPNKFKIAVESAMDNVESENPEIKAFGEVELKNLESANPQVFVRLRRNKIIDDAAKVFIARTT